MSKRILVCGGRDYKRYNRVCDILEKAIGPDDTIIHGGCPTGADRLADVFAKTYGHLSRLEVFYADWQKHGKVAGPIRNKQMLDEGKPDLVIAFPGGKGTQNMVEQAEKAGIQIMKIDWE